MISCGFKENWQGVRAPRPWARLPWSSFRPAQRRGTHPQIAQICRNPHRKISCSLLRQSLVPDSSPHRPGMSQQSSGGPGTLVPADWQNDWQVMKLFVRLMLANCDLDGGHSSIIPSPKGRTRKAQATG